MTVGGPESPGSRPRIVVGVDGSAQSERALEWATMQAQRTRAALEIVTAWVFPGALGYALTTTVDEVRRHARALVDDSVSYVAGVAPDVPVHADAREQSPGPALVEASKGADLLVVGSRGTGGFAELLVGSGGMYCARRAQCSVMIVR